MKKSTLEIRKSARDASGLLKSISNPHRLEILCLLNVREMSVGEINQQIDLDPSPVSQHLARLRKDKLVSTRKVSQVVYYSISETKVRKVIKTLYKLYCES
jgi:DNA-binding transcriptional ArsR family regulator